MPTREICCMHCGMTGEIEISELGVHMPWSMVFRHLGHNPFSGDMRYRCPACGLVLVVNPVDVIGEECLQGVPEEAPVQDPLLHWILESLRAVPLLRPGG